MKSILISIKPKWCELIASGKKTIEVRKTRPKCDTPFKCYIYCTKPKMITKYVFKPEDYPEDIRPEKPVFCKQPDASSPFCSAVNGNGKVIGEFICNKIDRLAVCGYDNRNTELRRVDDNLAFCNLNYDYMNKCQLSFDNLKKYSNGGGLYGWRISNFVIYDKPKELSEFVTFCDKDTKCCLKCRHYLFNSDDLNGYRRWCGVYRRKPLTRPPQSWCYCEELENEPALQ